MWNVRVLEVALLHPGKLITGACVYVLENRRGVDPRRPVAVERPHLDLHLLFGGFLNLLDDARQEPEHKRHADDRQHEDYHAFHNSGRISLLIFYYTEAAPN